MLTDWSHWLSHRHPEQLVALLIALLLTDGPRYALSKTVMCLWDWASATGRWFSGRPRPAAFTHCPSVCMIIAGHNEQEGIVPSLERVWGTYPRLEIIVVDDGSTDDMYGVSRAFARRHPGVSVLRRPERGGKSSAMNMALAYTEAEVIVVVDADSSLAPNAVWEIVQPLQDPAVGAVSGSVVARNPFVNLVTWFQAYEYLSSIFLGRMLAAKLGLLGIVSGAFGAFRRTALEQVMGWDVGPPEDLDVTLAIRKIGYKVAFVPYATCHTDVPTSWWGLVKQRLRWERSGVIRNHCRKHLDMACFWNKNFRWSNLFVLAESWFFNIFCLYAIWFWIAAFVYDMPHDGWQVVLTLYFCYLVFELIQVIALLYYSNELLRDACVILVFPFVPLYQFGMLAVRLIATTEEIFLRKSYQDNYVPVKVRQATWQW
jgi:poly-beta-1,6-N-acetyl-D-glucosamine synthase